MASGRILGRAVRIVATAGALLAAGAAVLALALAHGWERDGLRAAVASEAGRLLGAPVRIGALEGPLFGRLVLRDVEVDAPGRAPLRAERIELDWQPGTLLRERRLVVSARVVGLRGEVHRTDAGWLVSGWPESVAAGAAVGDGPAPPAIASSPALPISLLVRQLSFSDAVVTARDDDPAAPTDATVALEAGLAGWRWPAAGPAPLPDAATLTASLDDARVSGRRIDHARLQLTGAGPTWSLDRIEAAGAFGRVTGHGTAALAEPGATGAGTLELRGADGRLDADGLDLGPLLGDPRLATHLTGAVVVDLTSGGRLDWRLDLAGARVAEAAVGRVDGRGDLDSASGAWEVTAVDVDGSLGRLHAEGAGEGVRVQHLVVSARDVALDRLPDAWLPRPGLAGRASLEARLDGAWPDTHGQLRAAVQDLAAPGFGPASGRLEATALGGGRVRVDSFEAGPPGRTVRTEAPALLQVIGSGTPGGSGLVIESLALGWDAARIELSGRVSPTRLEGLRAELRVPDLGAATAGLGAGERIGGMLRGSIVADGPLAAPHLRGRLEAEPLVIEGVRLDRATLELGPDGPLQAASLQVYRGDAPVARASLHAAPEALAGAHASLIDRADSAVVVRADGLDVAWLATLLGRARGPTGHLDVDLRARGGTPPNLRGSVVLRDGALPVPGTRQALAGITGRLDLDGGTVRLAALTIPGGAGALRLHGSLAFRDGGVGPVELQLAADHFALPAHASLAGVIDGAVSVQGTGARVHADGTLRVSDLRVRLGGEADPMWKEIRVEGLPGEEQAAGVREGALEVPDLLAPASANVLFQVLPGATVQGRGADLRVAGEVRILKSPGEDPTYVGALRATRGYYEFQGRRFTVERGSVTLLGTHSLDPELDFVARYQVDDVTLRVIGSGPTSAPVLTLASDPPMDPADQLAYLAFGRPVTELGASDAERVEAVATSVVSHFFLGGPESDLAGMLPIDSIALTPGAVPGRGPGVEVGRRIGRRITVHYVHDLSNGGEQVRAEWRFHRHLRLDADASTTGGSGADVIWHTDY
jgi:autotransporter translocation and assembly factor TamB